jgi:hypothetical protein
MVLRSVHHLLQSLRSLAAGWRLGPDYERDAANYLAFIQLASIRLGCALMSPRLSREKPSQTLPAQMRIAFF